jgi:hypothetical protein
MEIGYRDDSCSGKGLRSIGKVRKAAFEWMKNINPQRMTVSKNSVHSRIRFDRQALNCLSRSPARLADLLRDRRTWRVQYCPPRKPSKIVEIPEVKRNRVESHPVSSKIIVEILILLESPCVTFIFMMECLWWTLRAIAHMYLPSINTEIPSDSMSLFGGFGG